MTASSSALRFFAVVDAPRSRSRLSGLTSGPVMIADALVPQVVEQVHRVGGRARVVDVHARDAEPRVELAAVDDRRAARRRAARQRRGRLGQAMAEEDQAVGLLAVQHEGVALLAAFVVLRVADEHRVVFALRGVLDALEDEREERVRDVGDGDEQLAGAGGAQVLRGRVRNVAEDVDGLEDLQPRLDRDDIRACSGRATPSTATRRRAWRLRKCWTQDRRRLRLRGAILSCASIAGISEIDFTVRA